MYQLFIDYNYICVLLDLYVRWCIIFIYGHACSNWLHYSYVHAEILYVAGCTIVYLSAGLMPGL